jgi:hypothetical protein
LIIAPAKTGKSILCEQLARGLSRGEPVIWWKPERPWRVSFVAWDAPATDYQIQFRAIDPDPPDTLQMIHYADSPKYLLDDRGEGARVFHALHTQHKTEFIIFDALESMTMLDINTKEGAQRAVARLKLLSAGRPFVVIHHPRKARQDAEGEEDPRNAAAGHHFLTTNSGATLSLRAEGNEGTLTVITRRGRSGALWHLERLEVEKDEVAIWVPRKKPTPAKSAPTGASLSKILE